MSDGAADDRVVGADRVLVVLVELAKYPQGITLEDLARSLGQSKSTVHRALGALRRVGLAAQLGRGLYVLGDEFLRLAYQDNASRPQEVSVGLALRALADRYSETAHYAVLDGTDIVYQGRADPSAGAILLTSAIGGRNPAHSTAVGKLLLSFEVTSRDQLADWMGRGPYLRRTPRTISTPSELWDELQLTRQRGFGTDDQENEPGINCVAVPITHGDGLRPVGAVSVSALSFRLPLSELILRVPDIASIIAEYRDERSPTIER